MKFSQAVPGETPLYTLNVLSFRASGQTLGTGPRLDVELLAPVKQRIARPDFGNKLEGQLVHVCAPASV